MGKLLSDAGGGEAFNPTANIKTAGAKLTGTLVDKRAIKTQYGDMPVYTMTVKDADCKFTTGKERKEVEPAIGDKVEFFASTRLERQLIQVAMGQTVAIEYLGTKKFGKGQPAHTYKVEVL